MPRFHSDLPPSRPDVVPVPVESDGGVELRYLVRSSEPAVVFTSLARLCAPGFADACVIDIVEPGELAYRIVHHPGHPPGWGAEVGSRADGYLTVRTPFSAPLSERADARYRGVITYLWQRHRPTPDDAARAAVLAGYGVTAVHEERLGCHREPEPGGNDSTALPAPGTVRARRAPRRPTRCGIRA